MYCPPVIKKKFFATQFLSSCKDFQLLLLATREPKPVFNNQMGNNTRALSRLSFPFHIHPSREMNLLEVSNNYIFLHIYMMWCLICAVGIVNVKVYVHKCRRTMRQSEKVSGYVRPYKNIHSRQSSLSPAPEFKSIVWLMIRRRHFDYQHDHMILHWCASLSLNEMGKKRFYHFSMHKSRSEASNIIYQCIRPLAFGLLPYSQSITPHILIKIYISFQENF
jgi:hypothetical protein